MIIVVSVIGLTLIMMLVSTLLIINIQIKELTKNIQLLDEETMDELIEELKEENKPEYKTHYTIEEAKEIDWKNVKFK